MAQVAFDPNKGQEQNTTDVLSTSNNISNQESGEPTSVAGDYVSDGNPYGQYAQSTSDTSPSVRKTTSGPSSGTHTNVKTYVDKNQAGSQRIGEAVAGNISSTGDITRQNLQNLQGQYRSDMDAGSIANRETALSEAETAFNQAAGRQPVPPPQPAQELPQEQTEASQVQTPTPASDDRLAEILNAQYKGPFELYETEGYEDISNQMNELQILQDLGLSSGSKNELLDRTFTAPDYTMGNRMLDDLLLGQGQGIEPLRQAANLVTGQEGQKVIDYFTGAQTGSREEALQRQTEMDELRTGSRSLLDTIATGRQGEINTRLDEVIENWDTYPQYFRDRIEQELAAFETDKSEYKKFQDLDERYRREVLGQGTLSGGYKGYKDFIDSGAGVLVDPKTGRSPLRDGYWWAQLEDKSPGFREEYENYKTNDPNYKEYQNQLTEFNSIMPFSPFASSSERIERLSALQNLQDNFEQKALSNFIQTKMDTIQAERDAMSQYENFDPNSFGANFSQAEAAALGLSGGEGFYNLLKEIGVEGLFQTAQADRNQLISQDEQGQLARLQQIAQLASDYGSAGSGIDYRNMFTEADLAGQQSALSALDTDRLANLLRGAESEFQDTARGTNVTGYGAADYKDKGLFGSKSAWASRTINKNLGDMISDVDGFRDVDAIGDVGKQEALQNLLRSQGIQTGAGGADEMNIMSDLKLAALLPTYGGNLASGLALSGIGSIQDFTTEQIQKIFGDGDLGKILSLPSQLTGGVAEALGGVVSTIGGALGGSTAAAQRSADALASNLAVKNFRDNLEQTIARTGYGNQFNIVQDSERDKELLELLGLLDTTNV